MTQRALDILKKLAAFTEHGRINQEARAKAYNSLSEAGVKANTQYPGMAYAKGTMITPTIHKLLARRQAYMSQGGGKTLKAAIPFVGMGSKGKEALENLEQKQQK